MPISWVRWATFYQEWGKLATAWRWYTDAEHMAAASHDDRADKIHAIVAALDPDLPRERWEAALPAAHVAFLRGLKRMHREGDYLFVHAGIRPGVPLTEQTLDDLVSIRQPFLWTEQPLGAIVVHGHSSNPAVVRTDNRIGLDTGAGMGGRLTCAVLEEDLLGLIAV